MIRNQSGMIPLACLLLAMILWASSFIALKLAFHSYDPMVVIFGRMAVASLCFVFMLKRFKGIVFRRSDLKYMLFMALCEPCLYFVFEAKALENTTASQAGMITAMLPLLVAVIAYFFLNEQITRQTMTGFVVAIAGAFWLSLSGESMQNAPNPALGNLFEFLAMVFAAGYTTSLKHLSANYPPLFLTALQAFAGSIFFLPFLFLPTTTLPSDFVPVAALAIVYLGSCITLGAYGLYNYGVSSIPASQAASFVNLIPVFTIIMAWLILGERFTPPQYLASLMVFAGVYISARKIGLPQRQTAPVKIENTL